MNVQTHSVLCCSLQPGTFSVCYMTVQNVTLSWLFKGLVSVCSATSQFRCDLYAIVGMSEYMVLLKSKMKCSTCMRRWNILKTVRLGARLKISVFSKDKLTCWASWRHAAELCSNVHSFLVDCMFHCFLPQATLIAQTKWQRSWRNSL